MRAENNETRKSSTHLKSLFGFFFYRDCSTGCDFLHNFLDLKKSCAAVFICQVPNERKNVLRKIVGVTRQFAGNFIRKCNIIHGLGDVKCVAKLNPLLSEDKIKHTCNFQKSTQRTLSSMPFNIRQQHNKM